MSQSDFKSGAIVKRRRLRLSAEYFCFPVWEVYDGGVQDIDPQTLPVSDQLKCDLVEWQKLHQSSYNDEYPPDSQFLTKDDELKFRQQRLVLCKRLKHELGEQFDIECLS